MDTWCFTQFKGKVLNGVGHLKYTPLLLKKIVLKDVQPSFWGLMGASDWCKVWCLSSGSVFKDYSGLHDPVKACWGWKGYTARWDCSRWRHPDNSSANPPGLSTKQLNLSTSRQGRLLTPALSQQLHDKADTFMEVQQSHPEPSDKYLM